eukprot:sb/3473976/
MFLRVYHMLRLVSKTPHTLFRGIQPAYPRALLFQKSAEFVHCVTARYVKYAYFLCHSLKKRYRELTHSPHRHESKYEVPTCAWRSAGQSSEKSPEQRKYDNNSVDELSKQHNKHLNSMRSRERKMGRFNIFLTTRKSDENNLVI